MSCLIDSKFLAGWHWNLAFNDEIFLGQHEFMFIMQYTVGN